MVMILLINYTTIINCTTQFHFDIEYILYYIHYAHNLIIWKNHSGSKNAEFYAYFEFVNRGSK